jgi:uncharacterized membrane-anchored protein YhcB (DUF1043 family)
MSVANQKFIQGKLNNLSAQFERKEKLLNKKIENLKKKGESNVELLKNLEIDKQKLQETMTKGVNNIFKEFTEKASSDIANAEAALKKSADELGSLESMQIASSFTKEIESPTIKIIPGTAIKNPMNTTKSENNIKKESSNNITEA